VARSAQRLRVPVRFIEVVCPDRELHQVRLADRRRDIEGFPEPDWAAVEARRASWVPWTEDRLLLDATRPRAVNLAEALVYLTPPEERLTG
jgi:hypothetical protein